MPNVPKSRLAKAVTVTAMMTSGKTLPPDVVEVYLARLARYPDDAVGDALRRCQNEIKGHLALRDIIERIDDGHPPPEEAWAMCPLGEDQSVVWTDEIAAAYTTTLDMTDRVAARMAFLEAYRRLIRESRAEGREINFFLSAGRDKAGRDAAVAKAVAMGRLTDGQAAKMAPQLPVARANTPTPQLPSADADTNAEVNTDEDAKLIAHYQKQIRANLGMDPFEGGE